MNEQISEPKGQCSTSNGNRPRIYTAREMEGMGLRDPRGKKEDPWDDDDGYC